MGKSKYEAEEEMAFKRIFEKYHMARKRREMMLQWRKDNPPPTLHDRLPPVPSDDAQSVIAMLSLTGELGGKRPIESFAGYLRRILDFVAVHQEAV
jgi:hypothetical protein